MKNNTNHQIEGNYLNLLCLSFHVNQNGGNYKDLNNNFLTYT